ncbi:wings apart-like protein homolog [Littorina saxatilis]|uniref:WAPL domain-containing protein n=1 Tax=Littorina saxatilis TaxID=31220 RepID=A0AAN9C399_9CAEN
MSSPSTQRRFGTAKTYGRAKENPASRSFDEMLSGKPAPIKSSAAYTKWGKTNFVAIRDEKKSKLAAPQEPEQVVKPATSEDPFSFEFDGEDKRKATPTKRVVVATQEVARTRLPASRLMTKKNAAAAGNSSSQESSESSSQPAIARPGRTYTRSQEGRVSSGSSSQQLIMDQFVEVGKTMKTDSGIEVVYSIEPHAPNKTDQVPGSGRNLPAPTSSQEKSPRKAKPEYSPSSSWEESPKFKSVLDDDEDDIFPVTFRRTPLKTYTGEIITPISDVSDDPPSKRRKKGPSGLPRGRKPSRYTDPSLIEEYRKRYEETHGRREPTAGMFNSTVVSSKELKGSAGTTLVVVCKPKVEVSEKKDDVQTKYFKNVKKELDKSDKNLEAAETEVEEALTISSTDAEPVSSTPTTTSLKKSPASSQESGSSVSTPTRMLRVRFADESSSSPASTSSRSLPSPEKRPTRGALAQRNKPVVSSSVVSVSSSGSSAGAKTQAGVNTRTRAGGKQYRIFKSRGPPQPAPKEVAFADSNSPPMPELTREVPDPANEDDGPGQNPPNIFDEDETEAATAEEDTPVTDSQVSQLSSEDLSNRTQDSVEDLSGSQERPMDSQDTPSPAASDDSQELSQEIPSSAESSQKDESTSAAPRRFFKSKKSSSASSLQRKVFEKSPSKASYNARSWQRDEESGEKEPGGPPPAKQAKKAIPFSDEDEPPVKASKEPKLTRAVHWSRNKDEESYTSVRVQKAHKELYTVVHNVKMAHEVQESGETQDFMDDVEYLLENLKNDKPYSIRALSTVQLAAKCIMPAFRMHLRAHGTVTKIFSLVHDACSDASLALSTASMMFMLSRDRLNMDLDKESLHLMLKLNEVDIPRNNGDDSEQLEEVTEESSELQKCRAKVKELLDKLQKETSAKQIDLDFVSTGNLAMESLLSLTSRRAGEWFKEELRQLGGLDHFVETINRCMSAMKGDLSTNLDAYTPSLKKLDRCLRVLENITFMNSDNQNYLISYNKGLLISASGRMLRQCADCLPTMPLQEVENEEDLKAQAGWIVFDCLLAILRVMLNITHDSELGCTRFGEEESLMETVLQCVVSTQWCVPPDQRFDLLVLSLGLLVNLMEHCPENRRQLVGTKLLAQIKEGTDPTEMTAVQALVQVFLQRETAARQMEEAPETPVKGGESPNKSGEWRESDSGIEWIAKSAEKVKAAEKERKEEAMEAGGSACKEGEKKDGEDGDKSIDGASILEDEETFTKALHKAGKHMENSIVASYVGLLLGCLIQDSKEYVEIVKEHLPDGSFEPMIKVLKKFLGFMSLTTAIGTTDANSLQRVIDTLEAC